jgi:hypothetical protein
MYGTMQMPSTTNMGQPQAQEWLKPPHGDGPGPGPGPGPRNLNPSNKGGVAIVPYNDGGGMAPYGNATMAPHTNGRSANMAPHTNGRSANMAPPTNGGSANMAPHTNGGSANMAPHAIAPYDNGGSMNMTPYDNGGSANMAPNEPRCDGLPPRDNAKKTQAAQIHARRNNSANNPPRVEPRTPPTARPINMRQPQRVASVPRPILKERTPKKNMLCQPSSIVPIVLVVVLLTALAYKYDKSTRKLLDSIMK